MVRKCTDSWGTQILNGPKIEKCASLEIGSENLSYYEIRLSHA